MLHPLGQTPPSLRRNRCWIFTDERGLSGLRESVNFIQGEAFNVVRHFPEGTNIPKGEGERVQGITQNATEFYYCREVTPQHMNRVNRAHEGMGFLPAVAFWIEKPGETGDSWVVRYALQPNFAITDALIMKEQMNWTAQLMLTQKAYEFDQGDDLS